MKPTNLQVAVGGTVLVVYRDEREKRASIRVPPGCFDSMTDDDILGLMTAAGDLRRRLKECLPGWTVEG